MLKSTDNILTQSHCGVEIGQFKCLQFFTFNSINPKYQFPHVPLDCKCTSTRQSEACPSGAAAHRLDAIPILALSQVTLVSVRVHYNIYY